MPAALAWPDAPPGPDPEERRGLLAAFAVALALHLAALALVAAWRSTPATPGDQQVTIDLAPQAVEAPTLSPVETSRPAGAPAPTNPVEPSLEVTPPTPKDTLVETRPVEQSTLPPPDAAVPPPATAQTVEPAPPPPELVPVVTADALPPESAPILSTAPDAAALPQAPTTPVEATTPPVEPPPAVQRRPIARPAPPRPQPKREVAPKPRPVAARPPPPSGEAGTTQRASRQGQASRENTGGASAAASDPNAMSRYAAQVAAALRGRLRYPLGTGVTGSATLRFTLHRSGRVVSAAVAASSGNAALDSAALATAAPGSSLPAAPDTLPQATFSFSVPVRFNAR